MPSNTHKYIIFTSMGCGGALVIALIVAVLMTQHGGLGRLMRDEPSTLHSPAALDSLAAVRAWYHGQPQAGTAYALRPAGAGDGARAALSIWRDTASVVWIPFGDTFQPTRGNSGPGGRMSTGRTSTHCSPRPGGRGALAGRRSPRRTRSACGAAYSPRSPF